MIFFFLAVCAFCSSGVQACKLSLVGQAIQGGLMIGRAPIGSEVSVDGKKVRVAANGQFLIGFGRDAPAKTNVRASLPDGSNLHCFVPVIKREYEVQIINGLRERQVTPKQEDIKRIRADKEAIETVRRLDTVSKDLATKFTWPVKGRVTGVFGSQRVLNGKPRSPHKGIDIAAPEGTSIVAPASGVVVLVHANMFFTGKTVMLNHGHGLTSIYVHMSTITVKLGEYVKHGQEIGRVGETGRATGPHLHWGISIFSTHLDPELLVGNLQQ